MNIQDLKSNTTWQEASNTINNNNNKISLAIATLENATLKNKGYFTSVEKLKEAIPNPTIGSKAYVGTSEPYSIYIVENGAWVDSGYTGGDEIVANITTDRIENGAVTSEKISTSAFDSTLSVSGKIAPAAVVGTKLSELESELYECGKNLVWNEGYVVSGRGCKASEKDKVLSPILLKQGEIIKVTTKGDGSYWQTVVGKVSSLDVRIEVNSELVDVALVTQDNQTLKTYAYTATEDVVIVVSALNDESTEVVFENLQKESKVEKNTNDITEIKKELEYISTKEIVSVSENIPSYVWSGYNNGRPYEDVLQKLPVGARLKKIKCASTGTKGSNFTFLHIYDNNNQLVGERIKLGAIGTTETTFNISSRNIVVKEGWHYCVQYVAQIYVGNNEYQDRYMTYSTGSPVSFGNGYAFGFAWEYEYEADKIDKGEKDSLNGKYLSTIGDSICAGAGFSGGYARLIAEKYGMLAPQNLGSSGATITQDSSLSNKTFISMLVDKMDENADFFIAEGGVNDADHNEPLGVISSGYDAELDLTTYCGAFEYICKQLVTKYHGKKVGYILVHRVSASTKYSHTMSGDNYYSKAIEICEKWGVPCLDLNKGLPPFGCIGTLKDLYTKHDSSHPGGDGYHPNKDGYEKYYVDRIASWMQTL